MIKFIDFNRKYKRYKKEINSSIRRVFERGWFIAGPERIEFENKFCRYLGAKYAVGVNSGTDSIAAALKAVGIKSGDEVITTSHTATPTISAIRIAGAIPVFVDIDRSTMNINPYLIEKKITSRTKAILPVHLYGYPADMDIICKLADKYNLQVIEDACQAHGAKINQKSAGSFGDLGCFSFYPTKNLSSFSDSGAIVTNNKFLATKVKSLKNYGFTHKKYISEQLGFNSRSDELQAIYLQASLKQLSKWMAKRVFLAKRYIKNLSNLPLILPSFKDESEHVFNVFVIRTKRRDFLKKHLQQKGIETIIHYPLPIHLQPAFRYLPKVSLPITEQVSKEVLSLPIFPQMTLGQQDYICESIRQFFKT